jgi:hypothetical protein
VGPVSVRVAGYGSPWCAPRYKACDETEDAVGLCAPAQPIWTPVIQKPTREGRRGLRNIRRPELGEMAMVLPLAVPAASAAPGTCISGAPPRNPRALESRPPRHAAGRCLRASPEANRVQAGNLAPLLNFFIPFLRDWCVASCLDEP